MLKVRLVKEHVLLLHLILPDTVSRKGTPLKRRMQTHRWNLHFSQINGSQLKLIYRS